MTPGHYNVVIYKGTTWRLKLTHKDSNGAVIDYSSGFTAVVKFHSPTGGDITAPCVLAATSPNIVATLTPTETAAINFATATYSLLITNSLGEIDKLLGGEVAVK